MEKKRYCEINKDNVVINIIVIDGKDASHWENNGFIADDGTAKIGGTWNGSGFDPPPNDGPDGSSSPEKNKNKNKT